MSLPLSTLANVGKATLGDFALLGIRTRAQLARRNAYRLYERLCDLTSQRHDPCVIDVFLATISECRGNPPRDWWHFTGERKRALAANPKLAPTANPALALRATRTASASRSGRNRADREVRRSQSQGAARRSAR
ncbi:MAG: helix-hairpin-helix domain-containing protein [bacterium]